MIPFFRGCVISGEQLKPVQPPKRAECTAIQPHVQQIPRSLLIKISLRDTSGRAKVSAEDFDLQSKWCV